MGRVKLGWQADPPVLVGGQGLFHEVVILAFGIDQLAESAGLVDPAHGVEVLVEGRGFEEHVGAVAFPHRLPQLLRFFERGVDRGHGAGHVLAVLEHLDAVPGMARRVGRDEHRLNAVVLHEFLERRIGLRTAGRLGEIGAAVGEQVADRDDLDVRVVLKAEGRGELAEAVADQSDADLAVGDRHPVLRRVGVFRSLLEARDHFAPGGPGELRYS